MPELVLERNLLLLREQGLQAILNGSRERLRELLETHIGFIGDYISARRKFQKLVSNQTSLSGLIGHQSRVEFLVLGSLEEMIRAVFRSNDEELIVTSCFTIAHGQSVALDSAELSIFQRITSLLELAFNLCIRMEDTKQRYRTLERISHSQEQFAEVQIEWVHLEKAEVRVDSISSYANTILSIYERASKETINRKDSAAFVILMAALSKMFSRTPTFEPSSTLTRLEARLHANTISPQERSGAEPLAQRLREEIAFRTSLADLKREILFGLGAWATRGYENSQIDGQLYRTCLERITPFIGGFEGLSKTYLEVYTKDVGEKHGWSSWEMELRPTGGAYAGPAGGYWWVDLFYAVSALPLLPGVPHRNATANMIRLELCQSTALRSISKAVRSSNRRLLENRQKWAVVLPQLDQVQVAGGAGLEVEERMNQLAEFWGQLAVERGIQEEETIIAGQILPDIIARFSSEFRTAWLKNSTLRTLAQKLDCFVNRTGDPDVPNEIKRFGLNLLEQKEWFTPERHMTLDSIAENLGRGMAESETEDVFLKIIEAVEPIEAENMNQCVAQIDVYLATKTEDERKSLTLLSAVGFRMEYEFYQARSEFWQPRSLEDKIMDSALRGWYRGVPLYDMQGPSLRQRPTLVVGDLRRLGRWNQFHAGRPGIDLEIIIEAITEARARELITARPEAFLVENGVRQTEEAAIRRWRKCVQLQVWQRYAFEIIEVVGAIRINLPKERIPDA